MVIRMNKELLVKRIREFRQEAGKTQAQMAEDIDVSLGSYFNYERNKRTPSLETMLRICLVLKRPADCFVNENRSKKFLSTQQIEFLKTLDKGHLLTIIGQLQSFYESTQDRSI